jgi:prepilin-type N-terminal cleavage/methylation domain-containing protein
VLTQLKKRTEGFTIIEVLIVLAIAGLIILIVLLAVPALQRNQRNTSRKNDASRVAGAVTNFTSNNNGAMPCAVVANCVADLTSIRTDAGTLGQYTLGTIQANGAYTATVGDLFAYRTGAQGALAPANGATCANGRCDQVVIVTSAQCQTTGGDTVAASNRSIAIQYTQETPGTGAYIGFCQNI